MRRLPSFSTMYFDMMPAFAMTTLQSLVSNRGLSF
jgi:hypothetical protein